jgi:glycerol-3-phosphate dehydrogenase
MAAMSNPWNARWRESALPDLAHPEWDLIVIGGGISGAGILREAARQGWRCLLLEQRDFAWGTSSRSSKMVHGGLRYIAQRQFRLMWDSVRERRRFLQEAPGLVDPLSFVMPHYHGDFPGRRIFDLALRVYDWMAGQRNRQYYPNHTLQYLVSNLRENDLQGGTQFFDAVTDDARLVMRVLNEARTDGAQALNGIRVTSLLRGEKGVHGLMAEDCETGLSLRFHSKAIAMATGVWTDELRQKSGNEHIRPLRGSHLLLPGWRLPVAHAVSFTHPEDRRPIFIFPWEGATVVGTTDLDHDASLDDEARISDREIDYLLKACARAFPGADISRADILSTWAGVRPIVSTAQTPTQPSSETREHMIWVEPGCVTLAGGKLTTFRLQALEVLKKCAPMVMKTIIDTEGQVFQPCSVPDIPGLSLFQRTRLAGRYGLALPQLLSLIEQLGYDTVGATDILWAELAFAAEQEMILHLDDLLLRRTRLGLLLPEGGRHELPRIQQLCRARLDWTQARWAAEQESYLQLWQRCYSIPHGVDNNEGAT